MPELKLKKKVKKVVNRRYNDSNSQDSSKQQMLKYLVNSDQPINNEIFDSNLIKDKINKDNLKPIRYKSTNYDVK